MTTEIEASLVKRGIWFVEMILEPAYCFTGGTLLHRTDVSKGPVFGRTITTDVGTGNIIVALLAVLTTLGKRDVRGKEEAKGPCVVMLRTEAANVARLRRTFD
jgi:hypothetical protein